MMTKQELIAFVQELPEEYFAPEQGDTYSVTVAERFYLHCCGWIPFGAISREWIAQLGYDVSEMTNETLEEIALQVSKYMEIRELLLEILDEMKIPKQEQKDEEGNV